MATYPRFSWHDGRSCLDFVAQWYGVSIAVPYEGETNRQATALAIKEHGSVVAAYKKVLGDSGLVFEERKPEWGEVALISGELVFESHPSVNTNDTGEMLGVMDDQMFYACTELGFRPPVEYKVIGTWSAPC